MKNISDAKVLIIEDAEFAVSLIYIFEDLGAEEITRISSITESRMIELDDYDIIFLDLNLIDSKDPDEVFRHISSRCDLSKIVVTSGIDDLCLWAHDRNVKCLPKPYSYHSLISMVKKYFTIS